ncbi:MAG: Dabb family protein [Bacteroidia bacterium]
MKLQIVVFVAIFIFTLGCKQNAIDLNKKVDKEELNSELEASEIPAKLLMHDVYLNLKDSVTEDEISFALDQLKRLDTLESTLWVHAGKKADTGDSRLNKDYDLALHVVFTSLENLKIYDADPTHADVRTQLKNLLAGPPIVFDYWTE